MKDERELIQRTIEQHRELLLSPLSEPVSVASRELIEELEEQLRKLGQRRRPPDYPRFRASAAKRLVPSSKSLALPARRSGGRIKQCAGWTDANNSR